MKHPDVTFGSLFSGIGAIDLGLERVGLRGPIWQVEIADRCVEVLGKYWPDIDRWRDIKSVPAWSLHGVDVICGGDPCPARSNARHIHGTNSEDLWPEFLRIVSAVRPVWVLREHVPSGDIDACALDLERSGYRTIVLEMDGKEITGQSRPREYLCGVLASSGLCPGRVFSQPQCPGGNPPQDQGPSPVANCLTTHPTRFEASDNYVFEPGRGTRILAPVERERLQGLPDGWTAGLSDRQRAMTLGNTAIVQKAEWIGTRIIDTWEKRFREIH